MTLLGGEDAVVGKTVLAAHILVVGVPSACMYKCGLYLNSPLSKAWCSLDR